MAPLLEPKFAAKLLSERALALERPLPIPEAAVLIITIAESHGDPLPLLAELFRSDPETARRSLMNDYATWATYFGERLQHLPRSHAWSFLNRTFATFRNAISPRSDNEDRRSQQERIASAAIWRIRELKSTYFWSDVDAPLRRLTDDTFAVALGLLEQGKLKEAAQVLVRIAVTSQSAWMRSMAFGVLPTLGTMASPMLFAILFEMSEVTAGSQVRAGISNELGGFALPNASDQALSAFFAGEALEEFSDTETVLALIGGALSWPSLQRARARRILARMSADDALPLLAWSAINLPSARERALAEQLLDQIINIDPALGIRQPRIGPTEFKRDDHRWLLGVVSEGLEKHPWLNDWTVAPRVLGAALRLVPELMGDAGYLYSEAPTSSRAEGFFKSVSRLMRRDGPGVARPTALISRHPELLFPASCKVAQPEQLEIRLLEVAGHLTAPAFDVPFSVGTTEVELIVLVNSPGFSVTPAYQVLKVPRRGPAGPVAFELRPHALGQQAIDVKFMHGTVEIGHVCLVSIITEIKTEGVADLIALEPFLDELLSYRSEAQAVFQIKTTEDHRLDWLVLTPHSPPQVLGQSLKPVTDSAVQSWSDIQGPFIRQILEKDLTPPAMESVLAQLAAIGRSLLEQIAPPKALQFLASLQEEALVVIDSDADWVPWELLALEHGGPLWAERFCLVRAPAATRPPNSVVVPPGQVTDQIGKALLVVGDRINRGSAGETFGGMAARAEPVLKSPDWQDLRQQVADKDIIHFACHGRSEAMYYLSYAAGVGGRLYASQAHSLGIKWGTVVFANACGSTSTHLLLADRESFGRNFYYAGARPFIGTLGPVPEKEAVEFAALFYQNFAFAGLPAGRAMMVAKQAAAKTLRRPVWLFYCLYGNPSIIRRWSAPN